MAAGHWLIFTVNDAGETVRLDAIPSTGADADRAAVVDKLRELVWGDLSPGERAEVARLPDGGSRMEVQALERGYAAGTGPTYWAKFSYSV